MISIEFDRGTLLVKCDSHSYLIQQLHKCKWDNRTNSFRLPASQYFELVWTLHQAKAEYKDNARGYEEIKLQSKIDQTPFPYQKEAIQNWKKARKRGYVVLPTGTGKSFTAVMALQEALRSSIVVVPTIELMHQWYDTLKSYFDVSVGLIGGGYYEIGDLTVITYDSAYRHMENIGHRFGLIIFDECHHLPSATYSLIAEFTIAPYRLGLSATPERSDGGHHLLEQLVGPLVCRKSISEMSGSYLAEYDVVEITAHLSSEEYMAYQHHRSIYLSFIREHNLRLTPGSWNEFIRISARSIQGRQAFQAYLKQKEIAHATSHKLEILQKLLVRHRRDRILIFTHDNAMAYKISKRFLIPVITHQTKVKERREYILGFNEGRYFAIVTSKVLNEGVNIPSAGIGVILSGSGSVREHVQRLGRILRKYKDKKATLYEIVTKDTGEESISQRRRDHEAYFK